jgi:hypothetical protein
MDFQRFDGLARELATTMPRRRFGARAAGIASGALGALGSGAALAGKRGKKCKQKETCPSGLRLVAGRCVTSCPAAAEGCSEGFCWRTFDLGSFFCGDGDLQDCSGLTSCSGHSDCGAHSLCADTACGDICRSLTD